MISKFHFFIVLSLMATLVLPLPLFAESMRDKPKAKKEASSSAAPASYPSMPSPGKKVPVGKDYYLIYGFDKKPKLGTIIMKIELYTADGKRDTSLEILGDSGMPSMRGAHETGEQLFRISKKGDYLLPINIVMPGDWEVRLTIKKKGTVLFRGSHQFNI